MKLKNGDNVIIVKVTAENGSQKEYKINAYVEETPKATIKYNENEIGIFNNIKNLQIPEGFNATEYVIEENTIAIYENGFFTIIYGANEKNERSFYLFDKEQNNIISKIEPMTIANKGIYLIDLNEEREGFECTSITINEKEVKGYKFKEKLENYILLVVMNEKGEKVEYLYETSEGTLQLYGGFSTINIEQYNQMMRKINNQKNIIYVMSGLLAVSIVALIVVIFKKRKEKVDEPTNQ